jgi:hypothetical protein
MQVRFNPNSTESMTGTCSRREFVIRCLRLCSVFASVGLTATACNKKETTQESKKSPDVCDDYSDVSESELVKRRQFAYAKQAPEVGKQCNVCKLYLPPKTSEKCGGCTLFNGPVDSVGSCTYWAPLDV